MPKYITCEDKFNYKLNATEALCGKEFLDPPVVAHTQLDNYLYRMASNAFPIT